MTLFMGPKVFLGGRHAACIRLAVCKAMPTAVGQHNSEWSPPESLNHADVCSVAETIKNGYVGQGKAHYMQIKARP